MASGVSIDTRTLQKGDLFIALKAQRDGHDFIAQAFSKGAAAAMASYLPDSIDETAALLLVDDVQRALEALGSAARDRSQARIMAVTGSVGKTSTKDMLHAILARQGKTHSSIASYNNQWGVPLTLARMPADTEFGIFEVGMNHPGEIAPLARQVRPHVVIITTVSEAHLEAFDNIEGIAREKASIMEGLEPDGSSILNADIAMAGVLGEAAHALGCSPVWFGSDSQFACVIKSEIENNVTRVQARVAKERVTFSLQTLGQHFVTNALGALASVAALGGDVQRAAADLSFWRPGEGRGARINIQAAFGTFEIIDDSYNANPASMAAALDVLALSKAKRRIAILGDMRELGPNAPTIHADLSNLQAFENVDLVHTVGPHMEGLYLKLAKKQKGMHSQTVQDLLGRFEHTFQEDDCILIKASLGTGLSVLVKSLCALDQTPQKSINKET